ncbi:hypothetical protein HPB47_019320 [Ixodes persulcatus]|uniref:Uncharacterized protein n=1 Tax=Ixodes persulcatus TaxID=34615 RepID=A0AC60QM32_IXOPE|nr:hypothetical protein HPB47_019320 [Ixodes persulcatus]
MVCCLGSWPENGKVITRALRVLPNLAKIVEYSTKADKRPTGSNYRAVENALDLSFHDHKELLSFIKIILCLSHGNAALERDVSVKKERILKNLKEESLIAQRVVHDAVLEAGGVDKVEIADNMVLMVRNCYSVIREKLRKKNEESREESDVEKNKKRVAALAKEL